MYKYSFMCFSVTFPNKLALYLTTVILNSVFLSLPPSCLFPSLAFLLWFFRPLLLEFSYMRKTYTCVFILFVSCHMLSFNSSHFPPMKVPFVCSLLMLCAPMGPHLLVEIPPHHCEIWIFTWIQFACLLSGCNIYADRGHVAFFCVIASFMLSTGNGPL